MTIDLQTLILVIPVVTGAVEIFKLAGLKRQYAGILAMVLGVVACIGLGVDQAWTWRIITGLAIGAAASGFYDYTKALAGRIP